MKVVVLTSSLKGTASHHLEHLLASDKIEVSMVVLNTNQKPPKNKWKKKIKKLRQIGMLGALNGIRMRSWYSSDIEKYLDIKNLEEICRKHHIPFKTVPSVNSDETRNYLREANADLGLSLGNSYIAKSVFSIPRFGMLNIHHEQLPQFQNAQSIIWQIYHGNPVTGFTIHEIDSKIDTGKIIYQELMPLVFRNTLADTVTYNLAQLYNLSALALVKVLENYDYYKANAKEQGEGSTYTTPGFRNFMKIKKQFRKLKAEYKN